MKLVWKYGKLSSISFLKSSILFHSGIFHTEIFVIFYPIPCPGYRFYIIIIIVTFYSNDCSQVENPEAPDFEKIASASHSFSTLSLSSSLPFPTSFIKVLPLPLPQKNNRFHRFRFQLPLPRPHPCIRVVCFWFYANFDWIGLSLVCNTMSFFASYNRYNIDPLLQQKTNNESTLSWVISAIRVYKKSKSLLHLTIQAKLWPKQMTRLRGPAPLHSAWARELFFNKCSSGGEPLQNFIGFDRPGNWLLTYRFISNRFTVQPTVTKSKIYTNAQCSLPLLLMPCSQFTKTKKIQIEKLAFSLHLKLSTSVVRLHAAKLMIFIIYSFFLYYYKYNVSVISFTLQIFRLSKSIAT